MTQRRHCLMSDKRGVSALEFALIAPLMILVFFGSVETSMLVDTDRRVRNVSATLADLVSRDDEVLNGEVTDVFAASKAVMGPYKSISPKMRFTSVSRTGTANPVVVWSEGSGGLPALAKDAPVTLPTGLLNPDETLIMAEVEVPYTSPIGKFLTKNYTLRHLAYARPRRGSAVARTNA